MNRRQTVNTKLMITLLWLSAIVWAAYPFVFNVRSGSGDCSGPEEDFDCDTLDIALSKSTNGDTVILRDEEYTLSPSVVLNVEGLRVTGPSSGPKPIIVFEQEPTAAAAFVVQADYVTLASLDLRNATTMIVSNNQLGFSLEDVHLSNAKTGLRVTGAGSASITSTHFSTCSQSALFVEGSARVFVYASSFRRCVGASTVAIEGSGLFRATNSHWLDNRATDGSGGAIHCSNTTRCEVLGSSFARNAASDNGGAIYASEYAALFLNESTFVDCTAEGAVGGGAVGSDSLVGLEIVGSVFSRCRASVLGGAVLTATRDVWNNIHNCTFLCNGIDVGFGAALQLNSDANITNCRFAHNHLGAGGGGGVYSNRRNGQIYISDSVFYNNSGSEGGGGILFNGHAAKEALYLSDCIFVENNAKDARNSIGGGVSLVGVATIQMHRCVFSRNHGRDGGGALRLSSSGYSPDSIALGCHFINNTASTPEAIVFGGSAVHLDQWSAGGAPSMTFRECSFQQPNGTSIFLNNDQWDADAVLLLDRVCSLCPGDGEPAVDCSRSGGWPNIRFRNPEPFGVVQGCSATGIMSPCAPKACPYPNNQTSFDVDLAWAQNFTCTSIVDMMGLESESMTPVVGPGGPMVMATQPEESIVGTEPVTSSGSTGGVMIGLTIVVVLAAIIAAIRTAARKVRRSESKGSSSPSGSSSESTHGSANEPIYAFVQPNQRMIYGDPSRQPLPPLCGQCGSDEVLVSRKKFLVTCEACGFTAPWNEPIGMEVDMNTEEVGQSGASVSAPYNRNLSVDANYTDLPLPPNMTPGTRGYGDASGLHDSGYVQFSDPSVAGSNGSISTATHVYDDTSLVAPGDRPSASNGSSPYLTTPMLPRGASEPARRHRMDNSSAASTSTSASTSHQRGKAKKRGTGKKKKKRPSKDA